MSSVICRQCGADIDAGTQFCLNCGFPVSWDEKDTTEPDPVDGSAVEPGAPPPEWAGRAEEESTPVAVEAIVAPPAEPPRAPGVICPVCSENNPRVRTYCHHCGALLVTPPPPPPPPPPKPKFRIGRTLAVVGIVAAAGVAVWGLLPQWRTGTTADTTAVITSDQSTLATTAAPSNQPVQLARDEIKASAEPVANPRERYDPALLIDGKINTAWNHCNSEHRDDADCAGSNGVGSVLTFTFSGPVRLERIEIANGYQKTDKGKNRFLQNSRIRKATVTTDAGDVTIEFEDVEGFSVFPLDVTTVVVAIRVDEVYEPEPMEDTDTWKDLAVSEVAFYTLPAVPADGSSTEPSTTTPSG